MNGWRQRVGVGILTAVFGLTVMAAVVVDGPCYEDVRVRGGHDKVNGRYRFVEMVDDGPWWECPSCPDSDETALWYRSAKKDWLLISFISSGPDWFYVVYLNDAPPGPLPAQAGELVLAIMWIRPARCPASPEGIPVKARESQRS